MKKQMKNPIQQVAKKLGLLTFAVTSLSSLSFASDLQADDSSNYTKEYRAQLEEGAKPARDIAEQAKESDEWKNHKKMLDSIDRRDRR